MTITVELMTSKLVKITMTAAGYQCQCCSQGCFAAQRCALHRLAAVPGSAPHLSCHALAVSLGGLQVSYRYNLVKARLALMQARLADVNSLVSGVHVA